MEIVRLGKAEISKMLQENEIVMLLGGGGVLVFIFANHLKLKRVRAWKILTGGFCVLLAGWLFTVLEGFFLKAVFNFLEHMCYAASSVLIAVWCWKGFGSRKESK